MPKNDSVIATRLSQDEKEALQAFCLENNVTASSLMRTLISEVIGKPLPLSPATKPHFEAIEVELRRIGVNLNQSVRAMNEGRAEPNFLLADALEALLKIITALRQDIDTLQKPKYQPLRSYNG